MGEQGDGGVVGEEEGEVRFRYYKDGEKRYREKFCWLLWRTNGTMYWLETVRVYERRVQTNSCGWWHVEKVTPLFE